MKNKNKKQKPKPIDEEGESEIRTWILECWVGGESSSILGWIFEHRPMTVKLSRAVDALRHRWRFWSAGVWSYGEGIEGMSVQMKSNKGILFDFCPD